MTERAAFEAWCDEKWGSSAHLHKSATCGEWAAWQAGRVDLAQVGDCGETCKRAKLCYACSKELGALTRGDVLRCIETDELCTVWTTSTSGKTGVKWASNDFAEYTAEQIGELFWIEPKPQWQGLTKADVNKLTKYVVEFKSEVVEFIRAAEAKLKEKND
jgi:hypothetical protein